MKKLIISTFALVAITLIWFGNTGNKDGKIPVGVFVPLSSDFAWWGENIQNTISLMQEEGRLSDFEFFFEDTKCDPKEAVSVTQNIKTLHPDMRLLIVGCDSDLKAMDGLLGSDYLAFMVGLSGADLYQIKTPTVNLAYRLETEGEIAGEFATKKLGSKSIGIITDNTSFGQTIASSVENYFKENEGVAYRETVKFNDPNPETQILKILRNKPDTVYLQNDIPGLATILKRLDQLGFTGNKITYYGGKDPLLIENAGKSAEGVYSPGVISEKGNSFLENFRKSFVKQFTNEPFVTSYFVYDGLLVLDEAESDCKNNVRCVEEYFYKEGGFKGTLGEVTYSTGGMVERQFQYYQVKDGEFVEVK